MTEMHLILDKNSRIFFISMILLSRQMALSRNEEPSILYYGNDIYLSSGALLLQGGGDSICGRVFPATNNVTTNVLSEVKRNCRSEKECKSEGGVIS
mmetsp:Transcript_8877/g.14491  ORF Transcript_8877/g.14491 Transcript_8877/m.14491 type:complete len:97 (+) Transcript_8877:641-931(+)